MPDYPTPPGGTTTSPPSTSPSTSTTSTTSSTSASTGTTGPTDAQRMALARLRSSYEEILRRWGLKADKNLLNLIEKGVRGQWSSTQFVSYLRQTPEYRQHFRGLQWRTGMSEAQYNSTFAQYKARAQDIGERLSRKEFALALKQGLTFDEYSDRVDAVSRLTTYAPFWTQFQQVLELRGTNVPGEKLTKKEMVKFVMGLGPKKWENLLQETILTAQLERVAGIQVVARQAGETPTPDSYEVTREDILGILKRVEALNPGMELEELGGQDFAELGSFVRQHSISYMQRYGLTTADLITARLGGPRAAEINERAERVRATQEAFLEPRAVSQVPVQRAQQAEAEEELPQSL